MNEHLPNILQRLIIDNSDASLEADPPEYMTTRQLARPLGLVASQEVIDTINND